MKGEARVRWCGLIAVCAIACAAAPPPGTALPAPATVAPEPSAPVVELPAESSADPVPPDRDHDGVPDATDACPDVPGVRTAEVRVNGCPSGPVLRGCKAILESVLAFPTNSSVVQGGTGDFIRRAAEVLRDHEEITLVGVEGFARPDEPGRAELSMRRARAVRDALLASGVARSRIRMAPKPGTKPQQTCASCACDEAAGRLVEISIREREGKRVSRFSTESIPEAKPAK